MKLWPLLLRPKPKARQYTHYNKNRNINLQFETRTYSSPHALPLRTTAFLYTFLITFLLLIAATWASTVTHPATGNYAAVTAKADGDVASAVTGLTNSYASPNYIKNYYQVGETEIAKHHHQQQHENSVVSAAMNLAYQEEVGEAGVMGRGFVGPPQPSNYGNALVARGTPVGGAGRGRGGGGGDAFQAYDGGFMPTTFTAAGQHYAASLVGLQTATDKINVLHPYASTTSAANKNNLQANLQPYGNVNNNNIAGVDSNTAHQHSLFRRLSNYGDLDNIGHVGGESGDGGADSAPETSGPTLAIADDNSADEAAGGTDTGEFMQNYALAYADNAQQSALLHNFYNQQTPFNDAQSEPEQTFANYFPQSMAAAATAGHEIENQQKYYTLNNYEQTTKPQQHQFEQLQYTQYPRKQHQQQQQQQQQQQLIRPYELKQQLQPTFNKLDILPATPATPEPATYYQTYIQHKNDNNKEQQYQRHHAAADNYQRWKQNQITANYQPKQSAIEKQQPQPNNQFQQHHLLKEPETAETSHSSRFKKSPKHKSKRHDQSQHEQSYSYDTLLEQNDNTIEHETDVFAQTQIQQLERLQEQLQLQQQQFIELQHQLIDHDQQLQIQKHLVNTPAPTLPPITQTVHHSPQSLQALSGAPLAKHTQVIRTIPIPQLRQVHVPYRENVTIEVPEPVITPIKKPLAIQIPVTRTVTIPKIQEVKIPIEKVRPFPVERPIPYIVERRVPYTVEKQIAQPVYYPVPIKVPILHTVIHKIHKPPHQQPSYHLPHTVYKKTHVHGHGHGHGHSHYY